MELSYTADIDEKISQAIAQIEREASDATRRRRRLGLVRLVHIRWVASEATPQRATPSADARANMSAAARARYADPAERARRSETAKQGWAKRRAAQEEEA